MRHRELPSGACSSIPESILTPKGSACSRTSSRCRARGRARERRHRAAPGARAAGCARRGPRRAPRSSGRCSARIMDGEATTRRSARLLVALRMKGETVEEIAGAARGDARAGAPGRHAPRSTGASTPAAPAATARDTFNISTAAAFVVAAAGVAGGQARQPRGHRAARAAPTCSRRSACGSTSSRSRLARCLETVGIGFLFAPRLPSGDAARGAGARASSAAHDLQPARAADQPGRRERQLLGVFSRARVEPLAQVLAARLRARAWWCTASDGLDELTLDRRRPSSPSCAAGRSRRYEVAPEDVGLARVRRRGDLPGGDAAENARSLGGSSAGERPAARHRGPAERRRRRSYVAGLAADLAAGASWRGASARRRRGGSERSRSCASSARHERVAQEIASRRSCAASSSDAASAASCRAGAMPPLPLRRTRRARARRARTPSSRGAAPGAAAARHRRGQAGLAVGRARSAPSSTRCAIARRYARRGAAAISVLTEAQLLRRRARAARLPATRSVGAAAARARTSSSTPYQLARGARRRRRRGAADRRAARRAQLLRELHAAARELRARRRWSRPTTRRERRAARRRRRELDRRQQPRPARPSRSTSSEPSALRAASAGRRRRVAESGIATRADVARLAAAGADAFLVGESLHARSRSGRSARGAARGSARR